MSYRLMLKNELIGYGFDDKTAGDLVKLRELPYPLTENEAANIEMLRECGAMTAKDTTNIGYMAAF